MRTTYTEEDLDKVHEVKERVDEAVMARLAYFRNELRLLGKEAADD